MGIGFQDMPCYEASWMGIVADRVRKSKPTNFYRPEGNSNCVTKPPPISKLHLSYLQ